MRRLARSIPCLLAWTHCGGDLGRRSGACREFHQNEDPAYPGPITINSNASKAVLRRVRPAESRTKSAVRNVYTYCRNERAGYPFISGLSSIALTGISSPSATGSAKSAFPKSAWNPARLRSPLSLCREYRRRLPIRGL